MKNMMNKVKGLLAVMMMACMLLTVENVSSNAEGEIAACGEEMELEKGELR